MKNIPQPEAPARFSFWPWFLTNWSHAGVIAGALLLALTPLLARGLSLPVVFTCLQLPIYMAHQYEEHAHGAFRSFVNHHIAHDQNALTDRAIWWINVVGVWLVDLVVLYLAVMVNPALGLIAVYLTLVNAALHIAGAIALRAYNPGLWTSLALFVPVGGAALYLVGRLPEATPGVHALGLGLALVIHIAVVAWIVGRARALRRIRVPIAHH